MDYLYLYIRTSLSLPLSPPRAHSQSRPFWEFGGVYRRARVLYGQSFLGFLGV